MIVDVKYTDELGHFIEFPEEMTAELGWKPGDTVVWSDNGDGTWSIKKKEELPPVKLVMVETVLTYRMRYCVEAPADHPEFALDTVTMEEAKEFSQQFLGEQIVSHRVVTEEEALKMCDVDNDYVSTWTDEQKKKSFFTNMEEQGYIKL